MSDRLIVYMHPRKGMSEPSSGLKFRVRDEIADDGRNTMTFSGRVPNGVRFHMDFYRAFHAARGYSERKQVVKAMHILLDSSAYASQSADIDRFIDRETRIRD